MTYANAAATLALLFAMSGGALAANHYLLNSTKQISPGLLKKLRGAAGPKGSSGPAGLAGREGPAGKEGATGKEGLAGKEGKEGKEGKQGKEGKEGKEGAPGSASLAQAFVQESFSNKTLGETDTLVVGTDTGKKLEIPGPSGARAFVNANVQVLDTGAGLAKVTCQLKEEGEHLETLVPFGPSSTVDIPAGTSFAEVPLTGIVELSPETYNVRVYCSVAFPGKAAASAGAIGVVAYEG
jgi:hypothetical protein